MSIEALRIASLELAPIACYIIFIYYAFCDGFKLHIARKIIWSIYFIVLSYFSFLAVGHYDLYVVVPLSSVLAFALCWFEKRDRRVREKK